MKKTPSLLPILLIRTSAILCICFEGLTSVVGASPLDTPPITNFFIPVNQRSVEPVRNAGDFIGRVFAPKPEDWQTRPEAQPITGVTVTIASGPRVGESVTTTPSGYYRFQNVTEDELHLRVEKEHFEPKEVKVHRSRPTILANGDVPNYIRDPQQHPGNILIGQRWPDEVRFILEETLVVHDLLYIEGGRPPTGVDLWAFYSRGVVVLYSYRFDDFNDIVGLLNAFAHEIAHAHQHATFSIDGSALGIHDWKDTPEGRAYEKAQRKDWEQVGESPLDKIYERDDVRSLTETAAEICAYYWGVDSWGATVNRFGPLEVEAPNRYRWAEKWVPINIAVRPPPKVVSILDQNLAIAIRKALGLGANVRITQHMMQSLTKLEAENSQIKNLAGLEHATRLSALTIGDNPISDFTPLKHLIQLEELSVWNSNFSNTMLLSNMTQLTHLWLGRNKINDITPFANLTQLKVLFLPHNHIRDVSPLAGLANLETLHLQDNSIRDIRPLTGLTKLTDLRLEINPITDKSPLQTLKNRNPNLKLPDIEIPPLSPVELVDEPNPLGAGPKIEGPWVWMIAPTGGNSGSRAASSGKDWLTAASGGSVTERHIATNGATPGVAVGNKVWTSGKLTPTGSNNIAEMVNTIGLGNGNYIEYHVAYGSLALNSPRKQNTKMHVGSDDAVKVWLNGVLVHNNPADRPARDYQDEFSVTLKQGRNILLVAVYNGELDWTGFFGFENDAVYSLAPTSVDVNQDKKVNKTDLLLVVTALGETPPANRNFDVNDDGAVNIADVLLVIEALDDPVAAAAPTLGGTVAYLDPAFLTAQIDILRAESDGSMKYVQAIAFFQGLLASIRPTETRLLANYPNPFNPETWIPYQLSVPADVSVAIYAADGNLIRRLDLGHQSVGMYESRSRAAYWDGRNALGEPVASSVYFYTLTAGEFTATRKMLIRK